MKNAVIAIAVGMLSVAAVSFAAGTEGKPTAATEKGCVVDGKLDKTLTTKEACEAKKGKWN